MNNSKRFLGLNRYVYKMLLVSFKIISTFLCCLYIYNLTLIFKGYRKHLEREYIIQRFLWQRPQFPKSSCKDSRPGLWTFGKTHRSLAEAGIRSFGLNSLTPVNDINVCRYIAFRTRDSFDLHQKIRIRSLSKSWIWSLGPCVTLSCRHRVQGIVVGISSNSG